MYLILYLRVVGRGWILLDNEGDIFRDAIPQYKQCEITVEQVR
jgi:hypothetical protein